MNDEFLYLQVPNHSLRRLAVHSRRTLESCRLHTVLSMESEGMESKKRSKDVDEVKPPANGRKRSRLNEQLASDEELWVDWGKVADGPWGREPLIQGLSSEEIEDLVGWATHLVGVNEPLMIRNPLVALPNVPLRPSLLGFIQSEMVRKLITTQEQELWQCFDTSALVAMGMILEEMLTASLLPLAEQHVRRCRGLDTDDQAFQHWTLPAEEAVMEIVRRSSNNLCSGTLPTSKPATRCLSEAASPPLKQLKVWCNSHGCSLEDARKNWRIYKTFLPGEVYETIEEASVKTRGKSSLHHRLPEEDGKATGRLHSSVEETCYKEPLDESNQRRSGKVV